MRFKKKEYLKTGDVRTVYEAVIERFTNFCGEILRTSECKLYAHHPAIQLLEKLYRLVDEHWYQMQELNQVDDESLFRDSQWNEIRVLAQQTKKALEQFVKDERKKDFNHEK